MCNGKTCGLRFSLMETTTLIKWSKKESEIMMGETKGIRLSYRIRKSVLLAAMQRGLGLSGGVVLWGAGHDHIEHHHRRSSHIKGYQP